MEAVSFTYFKKLFAAADGTVSWTLFCLSLVLERGKILQQLLCTAAGDGPHMIGSGSSIFKTWNQMLGSYLIVFDAACVCESYWRQKRRQKVFQTSQEGRQLQLTAWPSTSREETLLLVLDLRYLLTAMEWKCTKLQILRQFETTLSSNCLERQPNKKKRIEQWICTLNNCRGGNEKKTECQQNWEKMNVVSLHKLQCDTKMVESRPSFLFKMQKETSSWTICVILQPSARLHLKLKWVLFIYSPLQIFNLSCFPSWQQKSIFYRAGRKRSSLCLWLHW